MRLAISFDEQEPQVLDAFAKQAFANLTTRPDPSSPAARDWHAWVKDNARKLNSKHVIEKPGVHTLKVWLVDPGVVLEKLIVHHKDVRPSYFGPPPNHASGHADAPAGF